MEKGLGLQRLVMTLVLLLVVVLGAMVYLSYQPQDFVDVDGYESAPGEVSRNILRDLHRAADDKVSMTFTEKELNQWLTSTLVKNQGGKLADKLGLEIKGVWLRLSEKNGGQAELIIERAYGGRTHTMSMYLRVEREKMERGWKTKIHKDGGRFLGLVALGGKFGKTKVPQGFIVMVKNSFLQLAEIYGEEFELLEEKIIIKNAGKIRIEEDKFIIEFDE